MDYHMLTTTDNPFSPVTDYDDWMAWDMAHGYHTNSLLARVVYSSHELSDLDQLLAIEDGIDEIVEQNVSGVHTKVRAGTFEVPAEIRDTVDSGTVDSVA